MVLRDSIVRSQSTAFCCALLDAALTTSWSRNPSFILPDGLLAFDRIWHQHASLTTLQMLRYIISHPPSRQSAVQRAANGSCWGRFRNELLTPRIQSESVRWLHHNP